MNGVKRQFSLANLWDRLVRMACVATGWIAANGLPETAPFDWKTWAAFAGVILAVSYTGAPETR